MPTGRNGSKRFGKNFTVPLNVFRSRKFPELVERGGEEGIDVHEVEQRYNDDKTRMYSHTDIANPVASFTIVVTSM